MLLFVKLFSRLSGEREALPCALPADGYPKRLYNEALACSHLSSGNSNKSFVPFVGIYSTKKHPLALVFEFMDHQDLGKYLRNNQGIERLESVCPPSSDLLLLIVSLPRSQLLEIARGLKYMHSLGIVHGNVKTVRPILTQ